MNTQPTTRVSFDFKMSDMSEPSRILCRVDAIVGSVNGYTSFDPAYDTEVEDPNVSIFLYEILLVFQKSFKKIISYTTVFKYTGAKSGDPRCERRF